MVSSILAPSLARRNIHYGWVVVATTFLTMLVTAAAMGAPGVLIKPLQTEFGWETSQISSALAIRLLLFGLMGPFAAAFMNRFGLRPVITFALALIVAGFVGSLFMTQLWQLMLLWGIVVGFGTGLTAMVLAATVSARWFSARRGLVVGMLSASSATGQLVFLPLMAELTERYGWRSTIVFVCGLLTLAAFFVLALMRDRPSDLNLPAYGDNDSGATATSRGRPADAFDLAAPDAQGGVAQLHLLDPLCHVLHLRPQHQRADPAAFRDALR